MDHAIFQASGHGHSQAPAKTRRWIKAKYFRQEDQSLGLHWDTKAENGQMRAIRLFRLPPSASSAHEIRAPANPYDPAWEEYFEKRLDLKMNATLKGRR